MRWRKHWDNYGVVEVISTVVSIFMVLTVISAVMLWGVPYMEELKAKAVYENINSKLNAASNSIDAIIHETAGSSRTYTFAVEQGLVSTNNVGDRFVVSYSLEEGYDFAVSGLGFDGDDTEFTISGVALDDLKANVFYYEKDDLEELDIPQVDGTFTCDNPLEGTVRIDLYEDKTDPDPDVLFGRIFLFDLGLVKHTYSSVIGEYTTVLENNGILSIKSGIESVTKEPGIFSEDNLLALRIVQMRNIEHYSTGGSGKLRFTSTLFNNSVREILTDVHDVKLQVFGQYEDIWLDYFKKTCGFEELSDDPANGHTLVAPLEGASDMIVSLNPDGDGDLPDNPNNADPHGGDVGYVVGWDTVNLRPFLFKDLDGGWDYDSGTEYEGIILDPVGLGDATPCEGDVGYVVGWDGSLPFLFKDNFGDRNWVYDSSGESAEVCNPFDFGDAAPVGDESGGLYAPGDNGEPYLFKDTNGDWKYLAQLTITQSFCKIGFRI